jgi:hypothetical protein
MKFRITPLNFCTAFFLILAGYIFINGAQITGRPYEHWTGTITGIFVLFAVVVFFLDVTFRNFFPETKKLALIIFLLVK